MATLTTLMLPEETRPLTMRGLARPGLQANCNSPMGKSKPRDQGRQAKGSLSFVGHRGNEIQVGGAVCDVVSRFKAVPALADHFTPFAPGRGPWGWGSSVPWNPPPQPSQARWGAAQITFLCCTFSAALGPNWPGFRGPWRDWKPGPCDWHQLYLSCRGSSVDTRMPAWEWWHLQCHPFPVDSPRREAPPPQPGPPPCPSLPPQTPMHSSYSCSDLCCL